MSSRTTAIPTWLTGALVSSRIAWSATESPRKIQMSPVRVISHASSRVRRDSAYGGSDVHGTIIA